MKRPQRFGTWTLALLLILSAVLSLWVKKTGSCIFASL